LAYVLQRIGKDVEERNGSNRYLLNTLTDIPIYMKESYKANLPSFIKVFDFIIQKAEFLKNSNISLLWTILSDENTMIKNGSKIFVENVLNVFRENIIGFCESESKKCVNLFDMNNQNILSTFTIDLLESLPKMKLLLTFESINL
jgi:hypothetical protein